MRATCGAVTAAGTPCQNPPGCTANHQAPPPAGTVPAAGTAAVPVPDPLTGGGVVVVPDGIRERIARLEAARAAASAAEDEGSAAAAEMWSYSGDDAVDIIRDLADDPNVTLPDDIRERINRVLTVRREAGEAEDRGEPVDSDVYSDSGDDAVDIVEDVAGLFPGQP